MTPQNSIFVTRALPGDYSSPEPSPVLDELARHINHYGEHPETYRPMIGEAYNWVRQRFDSFVQNESMCEIYELLMGRPTDSPSK